MDRDSMQNLRLDRRLIGRRNWIKKGDLQREIDALPDVSDKVALPDEDDSSDAGAAPTPESSPTE